MEDQDIDVQRLVARVSSKEKQTLRRSMVVSLVVLLLGISWLLYSFNEVRKLEQRRSNLKQTNDRLEEEINERNKQVNRLETLKVDLEIRTNSLTAAKKELQDVAGALSPNGKRSLAILSAYDLYDRGIQYKYGGKKPEDGLDCSGFIAYILSQRKIGIDPAYCNQACLMNKWGKDRPTQSDLRPGDLIFYDLEVTMMYLGNGKCIGMLWDGIRVESLNFGKIIGYGRVPYGD